MEEEIKEEGLPEEEAEVETSENKKEAKESRKDKKLKEKIEVLEYELAKAQNEYYKAYADMDNLRKLMEKDHQQMIKYRAQGFLEAMLPVLDNFYMAFKVEPEEPTLRAYCKGFEMIYNQLVNALENEGVKEFTPKVGDKFDSKSMAAIDVVEGEVDDIVVNVMNKGYYYRDRLVRAANVVVTKKKSEEEKKEEDKGE